MQTPATTTMTFSWTITDLQPVRRLLSRNVLWIKDDGTHPSDHPEGHTPSPDHIKLGSVEAYRTALDAAFDGRQSEALYSALRGNGKGIQVSAIAKSDGSVYAFSPKQ